MRTLALLSILLLPLSACGARSSAEAESAVTYRLIRNATARLSYGGLELLLDPMPTEDVVAGIDAVLVSHLHLDHFDAAAADRLAKDLPLATPSNEAPVFPEDPVRPVQGFAEQLAGFGFDDVTKLDPNGGPTPFQGITLTQVFGQHGGGELPAAMGQVSGIVLNAPGQPTIYWTNDTIVDPEGRVLAVLEEHRPDIVIAHTGGAVMPGLDPGPLLMDADQAASLFNAACAANADVQIIAVHMEALDHCRTTREDLAARIAELPASVRAAVRIPTDGERVEL